MTQSNCEYCYNYEYDEETDSYVCDVDLDEDEMFRFMTGDCKQCPFFKPGNEYQIVKKQM